MVRARALRRARSITAGVIIAVAVVACYGPTELVPHITTDIGCDTVHTRGIAIRTARNVSALSSTPPAAESKLCTPGATTNDLGTITLLPRSDDDGDITLEVVLGVDRPPSECRPPDDVAGCVVARRQLGFVRHRSLHVPIALDRTCLGVHCKPDETCQRALCVSALVGPCPDGVCNPGAPAPPSATGDAAAVPGDGSSPVPVEPPDAAVVDSGGVVLDAGTTRYKCADANLCPATYPSLAACTAAGCKACTTNFNTACP